MKRDFLVIDVAEVVEENVERVSQKGSRFFRTEGVRVVTASPLAKYDCMHSGDVPGG